MKKALLILSIFFIGSISCSENKEFDYDKEPDFFQVNLANFRQVYYSDPERLDIKEPSSIFKIVHISDAHISNWSDDNNANKPINLREAVLFANLPEFGFDALISTGDNISNDKRNEALFYTDIFSYTLYYKNQIPTFSCTGNHDCNYIKDKDEDNAITKSDIFKLITSKCNYPIKQPVGENYYYSDIQNQDGQILRIISLDMLDQEKYIYNSMHIVYFSQKQIDWLINTALKEGMSPNHHIIILNHFPFQKPNSKGSFILSHEGYVYNWDVIPSIIDAYQKRSHLKRVIPNQFYSNDSLQIDTDFREYQGEFISYLNGHIHYTGEYHIKNIEDGELSKEQLGLICTNMAPSDQGKVFNRVPRIPNSSKSNSFCIYTINLKEHTIKRNYFGAYIPIDQPNYPSSVTFDY